MKITGRVRKLEEAIKPGECRACKDELLGMMYDPPHPEGKGFMFCGREMPHPQCPKCGRWPRLVITTAPPVAAERLP